GVQRERVEEDLRLRPARGLRQLDQPPAGDGRERLGVRRPCHPGDIDQGQVDIPQNQPVNDVFRCDGSAQVRSASRYWLAELRSRVGRLPGWTGLDRAGESMAGVV